MRAFALTFAFLVAGCSSCGCELGPEVFGTAPNLTARYHGWLVSDEDLAGEISACCPGYQSAIIARRFTGSSLTQPASATITCRKEDMDEVRRTSVARIEVLSLPQGIETATPRSCRRTGQTTNIPTPMLPREDEIRR